MNSNIQTRLSSVLCVSGLLASSLPAWAAGGLYPKTPPAPKAYVVEIGNDSENAKMTCWALQGMINRQSAEVYLINNPWDNDPLEFCGKPFERVKPLPGPDAGLRTLVQKYQARIRKMCLYDPDKEWTWYPLRRTNTQRWQTARFRVNDARFAGRQNGGADFGFFNGGDDLFIRAVRVKRVGF